MNDEKRNNEVTTIRLRAYERLTILIERLTPERLIERLTLSELTVEETLQLLLQKIRTEYDYNLSQQIYVSDELWTEITFARDQMAAFCAMMVKQLPQDANSLMYAQVLATAYRQNGTTPQQKAMETLKKEVRELL